MRYGLGIALACIAAFAGVTWWALESEGVAVIETRTTDGEIRSTHVWYTEPDGVLWLEAGSPENGWFVDVQTDPAVTFAWDGRSERFVARPVADATGHDRIRELIQKKYGFRDRWVGILVDTSRSVAVRLLPPSDKPAP